MIFTEVCYAKCVFRTNSVNPDFFLNLGVASRLEQRCILEIALLLWIGVEHNRAPTTSSAPQ